MSAFKVTLLFQDATGAAAGGAPSAPTRVGGWSESVYFNSQDINACKNRLYTAGAWGIGLCPARAALLPTSSRIIGQRIAVVSPRTGRAQSSRQGFPGSSGEVTDVPQMSLNCTIGAANAANQRRFPIRGIPDSQVVGGEFVPSFNYNISLFQYFNELNNWWFIGEDLTQPKNPVVTVDAQGLCTLTVIHNYQLGDRIQGSGLKLANGKLLYFTSNVLAVGPANNQFTISQWNFGAATGGTIRRLQYLFLGMNAGAAAIGSISVRKVGRPFDLYRGRRGKKRVA